MSDAALSRLFVAEPPAAFLMRPVLVVDCSVLCALLFAEPTRDEAERRLEGRALHAPDLIGHELANVACKKLRQGWPPEVVHLGLAAWSQLDLTRHAPDVADLVALAQRYTLSAYDAAYLQLAAVLKAPLATFDQRVAAAARVHLATLE